MSSIFKVLGDNFQGTSHRIRRNKELKKNLNSMAFNKQYSEALVLRGTEHENKFQYTKAYLYYEKALSIDEENEAAKERIAALLVLVAKKYKEENRNKKAKEMFQEALKMDPGNHEAAEYLNPVKPMALKMMVKMGYKEGQGLGKKNQSRLEPLPLNIKKDRRGLGFRENQPEIKEKSIHLNLNNFFTTSKK